MVRQHSFSSWLKDEVTESSDKKYRHRLITEYPNKRDDFLEELTSYVQAAHEDARKYLRKPFEDTLDPLGELPSFDPAEGYPELLDIVTLHRTH